MNSIFQPVVGRIVDLVRSQVIGIEEQTTRRPKVMASPTNLVLRQVLMKQ